jgi:tetratricopeptide (TPR) repeat protein
LPRDRLDKKQLKQDALVTITGRAGAYAKANANLFIGGILALIVVVVLVSFWTRGRSERSLESNVRAEASVGAFAVGEYQTALQMADAVVASYPGTRAASLASYVTGQANLQLGNFIAAEQGFRRYLDGSKKEKFYEQSGQLGLAASLEGQQRFAEAANLYIQTASSLPKNLAQQASMDAARCWRLAGSYDQAESLLEQVVSEGEMLSSRATLELAVVEALRNSSTAATPGVADQQVQKPSSEATP